MPWTTDIISKLGWGKSPSPPPQFPAADDRRLPDGSLCLPVITEQLRHAHVPLADGVLLPRRLPDGGLRLPVITEQLRHANVPLADGVLHPQIPVSLHPNGSIPNDRKLDAHIVVGLLFHLFRMHQILSSPMVPPAPRTPVTVVTVVVSNKEFQTLISFLSLWTVLLFLLTVTAVFLFVLIISFFPFTSICVQSPYDSHAVDN